MIRAVLALLLAATVVMALVIVMRPACVTDCTADRLDEARICNEILRGIE